MSTPAPPMPATAAQATAQVTTAPTTTTGATAAPNAARATPGFTIVRARRPDGTIVRFRRPIVAEVAGAANGAATAAVSSSSPNPASEQPSQTSAARSPTPLSDQTAKVTGPVPQQATAGEADPRTQNAKPQSKPAAPAAASTTSSNQTSQELSQKTATPSLTPTFDQTLEVTGPAQQQAAASKAAPATQHKPVSKPAADAAAQQNSAKSATGAATSPGPSSPPPQNAIPGAGFQVLSRFGGMARRGLFTTLGAIHPDLNMGDDLDDLDDFVGDMQPGDETDDDGDDNDDDDDDDDDSDSEDNRSVDEKTRGEEARANGAQGDARGHNNAQGQNNIRSAQNDTREVVNAVTGNVARTLPFWSTARPPPPAAKPNGPNVSTTTPKPAAPAPNGANDPVMSEKTSTPAEEQAKPKPMVQVNEKQLDSNSDLPAAKPQSKPPRTLNRRSPLFALIIVWFITVCLPLLFIVLGVMTIRLYNEPADSYRGFQVSQAIKVAVTSWPIVFAAIVAQSLKAFATYRVERGIRLMTLEQLISSNSFASAMKQPLLLRRLNLTTISLFVLWSLSPLASQALQRISYTTDGFSTNTTIIYFVDNTASNPVFAMGAPELNTTVSINNVYTAAILPRGSQEPINMDAWRYPLIPAWHLLAEDPNNQPDKDTWFSIQNLDIQSYASPLGLPYMPLPYSNFTNGTYSLILPSTYFRFQCQEIKTVTFDDVLNFTDPDNYNSSWSNSFTGWMNMNPPQQKDQAGNFSFASLVGGIVGSNVTDNSTYAYSTCALTQIYVDSDIFCDDRTNTTNCVVRRIRKSTNTSSTFYPLKRFTDHIINAGATYTSLIYGTPTLWERYLMDPQRLLHDLAPVDLTKMVLSADKNATATLERRLGRLFNTYWQAGFDPMYQTGFYPNYDDIKAKKNFSIGENHHNVRVWGLYAIFTNTRPVFVYSVPWLVVLFFCAVILLVTGVASAIWESLTIAPDILGFASSIVRSSKYIDLPKTSTHMTGPERARAMAEVRVMMQDVRPQADVGRIALKPWTEESTGLVPGRYYR